jgi:hypothetical protein
MAHIMALTRGRVKDRTGEPDLTAATDPFARPAHCRSWALGRGGHGRTPMTTGAARSHHLNLEFAWAAAGVIGRALTAHRSKSSRRGPRRAAYS